MDVGLGSGLMEGEGGREMDTDREKVAHLAKGRWRKAGFLQAGRKSRTII